MKPRARPVKRQADLFGRSADANGPGLLNLGARRKQWADYVTTCLQGRHYNDDHIATVAQLPGAIILATGCAYVVQDNGSFKKITREEALDDADLKLEAPSQLRVCFPKQSNKYA